MKKWRSLLATPQFRPFALAVIAGCGMPIAVAYDARSAPGFAFMLLLWSIVPFVIALVIFFSGKRAAAWGWLIAIVCYATYAWASIKFSSQGSTSAIGFIWIPIWNSAIVGPMGASVGVLLARALRSRGGRWD